MRYGLIWLLVAILSCNAFAQPASNQPIVPRDGRTLAKYCESWERLEDPKTRDQIAQQGKEAYVEAMLGGITCFAYLQGFIRGHEYGKPLGPGHALNFCLPSAINLFEEPMKVLASFLRNNPGSWHMEPDLLMGIALRSAYPCSSEGTKPPSKPQGSSSLSILSARLVPHDAEISLEVAGARIRQIPVFVAQIRNDFSEDVIEGDFKVDVSSASGVFLLSYRASGQARKTPGSSGRLLAPSKGGVEILLVPDSAPREEPDSRRNRVVLASDPAKVTVTVVPTRILLANGKELRCSEASCSDSR